MGLIKPEYDPTIKVDNDIYAEVEATVCEYLPAATIIDDELILNQYTISYTLVKGTRFRDGSISTNNLNIERFKPKSKDTIIKNQTVIIRYRKDDADNYELLSDIKETEFSPQERARLLPMFKEIIENRVEYCCCHE